MTDTPQAPLPSNPVEAAKGAGSEKQPGTPKVGGSLRRAAGSAWDILGKVPVWLKAISAVIGFVVLFSQQLAQLPGALTTIATTIRPPRHPGSHVVFVSNDELLAKSYLALLAGSVTRTEPLDTSQVDTLPHLNPDLVIFGSGAREPEPLLLSPSVRSFLEGDVKVMGMGSLGSLTLQQIQPFSPLTFRHSIGIGTSEVLLDSHVDKRIRAGLPTDHPFKLYEEDAQVGTPGLAVFDAGSLPLLGATGIAELGDASGCTGHSWPIARQGNDLFWGYAIPGTALTVDGALLFLNTVLAVLQDDFQKPLDQQHYKLPGSYHGDALGCLFSTNEYRLPVSKVGAISVAITSKSGLVLTITGPRPADLYTAHGSSPRLVVPVTRESLAAGQDWLVTVAYTGPMTTRTRIDYDFDLQYPSDAISQLQAVLAAVLLALTVVFGVLSIVYLARSRHPLRPVMERIWSAVRRRPTGSP